MAELIGSRICGGNTAYRRNASDFYPTPPDVTQALLDFLKIPDGKKIWEPACGEGHMVKVFEGNGYTVRATDLQTGTDFLKTSENDSDWIITNPPWQESTKHSLSTSTNAARDEERRLAVYTGCPCRKRRRRKYE